MTRVSMAELRRKLAHYLDRVEQGEQILIERRGTVIASLQPRSETDDSARRRLMAMQEKARIGDVTSPIDASWDADRAAP